MNDMVKNEIVQNPDIVVNVLRQKCVGELKSKRNNLFGFSNAELSTHFKMLQSSLKQIETFIRSIEDKPVLSRTQNEKTDLKLTEDTNGYAVEKMELRDFICSMRDALQMLHLCELMATGASFSMPEDTDLGSVIRLLRQVIEVNESFYAYAYLPFFDTETGEEIW